MQLIQHPHSGTTAIGLLGAALLLTVGTFTVSGAMCLHDLAAREIAASLQPLNAE
ncbi:hypothetical protein [Methylobacterium soli]|jgi:hypothetical protein|uniref:hypothetical protein n=1 Tax=Methylobacterium soli TaxID=553447 RepID=UPI001781AC0A|nr:hypothetical protein [Methylobacterium soli]GJE42489.1 hypothetical protein AEGHOMDF_1661 [Methylobacterium soli]